MINPFIYGVPVPPNRFINREDAVKRICDQLKGPAFGSLSIVGEWRIGKTSLLHYIVDAETRRKHGLDSDRLHFVSMDCQAISRFTPTKFWQEALTTLAEQLGDGDLKSKIEQVAGRGKIGSRELRGLLKALNDDGRRAVLVVDEFDRAVRLEPGRAEEMRDFLGVLRSLLNYTPRTLAFVIATRQKLSDLTRGLDLGGSPFYNIWVPIFLEPFDAQAANELIDQTLEVAGVGKDFFTEEDRHFVYEVSKGHPHWLQSACSKLFDSKGG